MIHLTIASQENVLPWWSHEYLAFALLAAVLLAAAFFDIRTTRIPTKMLYTAIVLGFVLAAACGLARDGWSGMSMGLGLAGLAFLSAAVPFFLIFHAGGLGGGDVKLMAAVGAISASWEVVIGTAMYGFVAAMIIAFGVMIKNKIVGRTLKRVATAALLTATTKVKPNLDTDTPRIPLAVGFCIGGVLASLEFLLNVRMPWG
jgi:prepilin peptidase CpaA